MKSLFGMEMYKLWSKKGFQILMVLMFVLNLSLFAYAVHQSEIPISAYEQLQAKLLSLSNEKRYDYICEYDDIIQKHFKLLHSEYPDLEETTSREFLETAVYYTGSLEKEALFMGKIRKEMDKLHDYHDYLMEIQQKADSISSISIFADPSSYSSRNIRKTAEDFQHMQDIVVTYQLEKGIKEALHFPLTDVMAVLITGVIAAAMILEEKEKHLFSFVKPSLNGGWKTIRIKCFVMVLSIAVPIIALYACNLLYMQVVCGLGSLQASLQSLAQYTQSTLHMSIGGYLLLFIATKWIAASIIGAFMMLITIFSKQRIHCFGGMLLILGVEFLCYQYLPNHHAISVFRYINLISFLRTDVFYKLYYNLNLFQQAYSLQKLAQVIMIAMFLTLLVSICIAYVTKQNLQTEHLEFIRHKKHRHILPVLWIQEGYKVFCVQKGVPIILLFLMIQMYSLQNNSIYVSMEERSYMQYMGIMQGKPSAETDSFLSSQQQHYDDLHLQYDKNLQAFQDGLISKFQFDQMQSILELQFYSETMFQKVVEQYAYVKENPFREMLVPFGYERLLFVEEISLVPAMLSILSIILLFSNLLCAEYTNRADRLLLACRKGDKPILHCKLRIALICGLLLTVTAYLPDTVHIVNRYGCQGLCASITSLQEFAALPSSMTVITYLGIQFLLKLLAVESAVFLLLVLSKWLRHQAQVIFLLLMLTVVPVILHSMGIYFLDSISLYPLLCSSILLKNGQWLQIVISAIGYSMLCVTCYHHSVNSLRGRYRKQKASLSIPTPKTP